MGPARWVRPPGFRCRRKRAAAGGPRGARQSTRRHLRSKTDTVPNARPRAQTLIKERSSRVQDPVGSNAVFTRSSPISSGDSSRLLLLGETDPVSPLSTPRAHDVFEARRSAPWHGPLLRVARSTIRLRGCGRRRVTESGMRSWYAWRSRRSPRQYGTRRAHDDVGDLQEPVAFRAQDRGVARSQRVAGFVGRRQRHTHRPASRHAPATRSISSSPAACMPPIRRSARRW